MFYVHLSVIYIVYVKCTEHKMLKYQDHSYTECNERSTNGLVADTKSQTDGRDLHISHSFHFVKNA
jgi:hypothetical protein